VMVQGSLRSRGIRQRQVCQAASLPYAFHSDLRSSINLVERFAEITNKRIRRGILRSVKELEAAIREYIVVHNEDPKPFVWTKTPDEIPASIVRFAQRTSPAPKS